MSATIKFVPPIHPGEGPHWVGHFEVLRGTERLAHVRVCLSNRLGEELCPALDMPSLEEVIRAKGEEIIRGRIAVGDKLPDRLDIDRDASDLP